MSSDARLPSRRAVVRGVAWSVPVVSVAAAAPAFAASPCDTTYSFRLDWGTTTYTPPASLVADPNRGSASVPASSGVGASPVGVTLTSTLQGTATRYDSNLTVLSTQGIGGLGATERGVAIRSATTGSFANRQTITLGFARSVQNVSFTVVDLDRAANFNDRVSFDPLPSSYTRAPLTVAGVGSTSTTEITSEQGAFRYTGLSGTGIDDTSGAGNVTVTFASPLTSLQLIYWSTQAPGPQGILLSDVTFSAKGC